MEGENLNAILKKPCEMKRANKSDSKLLVYFSYIHITLEKIPNTKLRSFQTFSNSIGYTFISKIKFVRSSDHIVPFIILMHVT